VGPLLVGTDRVFVEVALELGGVGAPDVPQEFAAAGPYGGFDVAVQGRQPGERLVLLGLEDTQLPLEMPGEVAAVVVDDLRGLPLGQRPGRR